MRILSIVGISGSGKTTSIEYLIKELKKRGFSTGTVKQIHHKDFSIDTKGTNTYRHRQAGADIVTARGVNETDILFNKRLGIDEILKFYDHDFVLLEGVKDYDCPLILCINTPGEIKDYYDRDFFPRIIAVSGKVAKNTDKRDIVIKTDNGKKKIPLLDSIKDTAVLTDLIIKKTAG